MRRTLGLSLALLALASLPAAAWEVNVENCSAETLDVKSYNQDDTLRWIPYETISVAGKSTQKIGCQGISSCQLYVSYGNLAMEIKYAGWAVRVLKINAPNGATIFTPTDCP